MKSAWKLLEACVLPIILYASETLDLTPNKEAKVTRIYDNLIKQLLKVPVTTPRETLYIETGLLDISAQIRKRKLLYSKKLKDHTSQIVQSINRLDIPNGWWTKLNEIETQTKVEPEDQKNSIKRKIQTWFHEKITNDGALKSKVQYLLSIKQEWQPGTKSYYLVKLNRTEASIMFRARSRMLKVRDNFRNGSNNTQCRACQQKTETQLHVLNECPILHSTSDLNKVMIEDLHSEDILKLKQTAWRIVRLVTRLEQYDKM